MTVSQKNKAPVLIHIYSPTMRAVKLLASQVTDVLGSWSVVQIGASRYLTNFKKNDGADVTAEDISDLITVAEEAFSGNIKYDKSKNEKIARICNNLNTFVYKEGMVPLVLRRIGRRKMIAARGIEYYSRGVTICCATRTPIISNNWRFKGAEEFSGGLDLDGEKAIFDLVESAAATTESEQNETTAEPVAL